MRALSNWLTRDIEIAQFRLESPGKEHEAGEHRGLFLSVLDGCWLWDRTNYRLRVKAPRKEGASLARTLSSDIKAKKNENFGGITQNRAGELCV